MDKCVITSIASASHDLTLVKSEGLSQRRVRFGRLDQGIEKNRPVALAERDPLAVADETVGGIERAIDDERRDRRVGEAGGAFLQALGTRIEADLDAFGLRRSYFRRCVGVRHFGAHDKLPRESVHRFPHHLVEMVDRALASPRIVGIDHQPSALEALRVHRALNALDHADVLPVELVAEEVE